MTNLQPLLDQAWKNHQSGDIAAAQAVYRHVLALQPRHAAALVYLGISLFDQRRFAESVRAYRDAITVQPEFPVAWNNLGNALRMVGEIDEADRCFGRALEQRPGYLSPMKNRGTLWIWAGEIERGLASYRDALSIAPDETELHRNLGVIYLLQENFRQGWPEYRYRWKLNPGGRPGHPSPIWNGEDPAGKTFLLYPEQGIGDAIHFIRAAHTLRAAGARTILQCPPQMVPLYASAGGIDAVVPQGVPVEQLIRGTIDYQASLIDVIDHWYGRTGELAYGFAPPILTRQTSGTGVNPNAYLDVSESLVDYWRRSLPPGKRRVGICWQGSTQHHADVYRSVPLERFEPLATVDGVSLVSLQHGQGREQLDRVTFRDCVVRLPETIDQSGGAFLDTAAIILNLDLVITVDTSTAHLAAALGKPVWLVLGKVPDWRWRMQGELTPWYPTMRLFRQTRVGDWDDVFASLANELRKRLGGA
jgi:tetratricopeptide (TPR) repeat protein